MVSERQKWSHLKHWTLPPQTPQPEAQAPPNTCTSHQAGKKWTASTPLALLPSPAPSSTWRRTVANNTGVFQSCPLVSVHSFSSTSARCEVDVKHLPHFTPPPQRPLPAYLHLRGPSLWRTFCGAERLLIRVLPPWAQTFVRIWSMCTLYIRSLRLNKWIFS